jgi:uncharacterized protein (DUF983 family)
MTTKSPKAVSASLADGDGRSRGARSILDSLLRGTMLRCPACGVGRMFGRYLKVVDHCGSCGEVLHHHRADDAPPYFTIVIVGHVVVSLVLAVEMAYRPPLWLHAALWLPLTGALVGLQWALLMHGFDPEAKDDGYAPFEEMTRGPSGGRT